jgi:hypothetical protein
MPMQTYYTNEVRFLLPDGCLGSSVNAFVIPKGDPGDPVDPSDPGDFSLVVTRTLLPAEMTLSTYLSRQLEALDDVPPEFHLLSRRLSSVDNLPAEQVDFTWQSETAPMRQQQTHFLHGPLVVTVTGTAEDLLFSRHRAALTDMLATMKIN